MHTTIGTLRKRLNDQRGSALVMAVFVLVMLTGMGVALLFLSRNEVKMSQASLRAKQAFYIAEAGVEDARLSLWTTNKGDTFNDDLQAAAGANGALDLDPDAIQPVYDGNGNFTGFTGFGDDVALAPMTAIGEGWYTAFLTNDPNEPDPFQLNLADTNERVMITSAAVGADRSFEVVQAIVELRQIFPSIPPATVTLIGESPVFLGGVSMAKEYIGDDCDGAGVPGLFVPTIGVIGPAAAVDPCPPSNDSVVCGMDRPNSYQTGYGTYTGTSTAADVTDPGVIGGIGPIDPDWNNCQFLQVLVEEVRAVADVICPEGRLDDCPNLPPSSPGRIIFVDGEFFVDAVGVVNEGLLLVTGELHFHGDSVWNGMLFAVGEGIYTRYGGGQGPISGSIFVADIAGPDQIYDTADDCSSGVDGFDQAVFNQQMGGMGDHIFCTLDMIPALPVAPYEVVDFLQR